MRNTICRRSFILLAGLGVALTLAACDSASSVTQPALQRTVQPAPRHDGTDTTCISGYIDALGRWVCG
jgi:hypothetical protein